MTPDEYGTPELFEVEPTPLPRRRKGLASVAQGTCPVCLRSPLGILRQSTHLVWRQHNYRTWGDSLQVCRTSGVALCVAPECNPLNPSEPVRCDHV